MSPGDRGRNQTDFIIALKRFRNAILSSCGSHHVPVVCVMRTKLQKFKKPKQSPKFQYDALKKDTQLRRKFNVAIENKFEIQDQLTEVYSNSSNSKYLHDQIKDVVLVGRKPSSKSGCIKSQSGQILMDIADTLKRWSQYVDELFDDVRGP
ncbi:hypothetical protein ElyMa_004846300 [Elysia marginata]|uniref:Uncharacterized protein n=1 Tax=Elysia marginata TaxID=1093978 RepID=A0AAV4ITT2_9GAST|nr:hypothetical protein ElyMa_004846300 [Elysia marginata]